MAFQNTIQAYAAASLDFNQLIIDHPSATFAVRCDGEAMLDAGIYHNDILVVDRSLSPKNNQIVLIANGADFLVRRYAITVLNHQQKITFHHQNTAITEDILEATEEGDVVVIGVVTFVLKDMRRHDVCLD